MATAETVDLGPAHAPKAEALKAFDAVHVDIKKALQHLRHDANSKSISHTRYSSQPKRQPNLNISLNIVPIVKFLLILTSRT